MRLMSVVALAAVCAAACGGGTAAETASPAAAPEGGTVVPAAEAASAPAEAPVQPVAEQYHEVTLPAGTSLRLKLVTAVSSDKSKVEDAVRAELRQAVAVKGQSVLPAGTEVVGVVTDAEQSGRVKGRARVAYRFNSLRYAGERYEIQTAAVAHQAEATKGEDTKKIAIGAGAGAALGALLGGGSGAAKGAAIGGAGGTGVVLATRGKEVRLGPGANVTTRLTAPLTVRVRS